MRELRMIALGWLLLPVCLLLAPFGLLWVASLKAMKRCVEGIGEPSEG